MTNYLSGTKVLFSSNYINFCRILFPEEVSRKAESHCRQLFRPHLLCFLKCLIELLWMSLLITKYLRYVTLSSLIYSRFPLDFHPSFSLTVWFITKTLVPPTFIVTCSALQMSGIFKYFSAVTAHRGDLRVNKIYSKLTTLRWKCSEWNEHYQSLAMNGRNYVEKESSCKIMTGFTKLKVIILMKRYESRRYQCSFNAYILHKVLKDFRVYRHRRIKLFFPYTSKFMNHK